MKRSLSMGTALVLCLATAGAWAQTCEEAWAAYNEFKQRNVMEPSQYPLTEYGARVRAACGPDALPVPPGTDTPRYPIVRKPHKPLPPPPPYKPKN
jgi:hypothetical protein